MIGIIGQGVSLKGNCAFAEKRLEKIASSDCAANSAVRSPEFPKSCEPR
jgi:hypothetical protein